MSKNAIISVSDKKKILYLANFLFENDFNIYSTGGTYKIIRESFPDCKSLMQVSDLTNFPEILNGRVKTLHPHIYGGLLADKNNNDHMKEMDNLNLPFFDLVVVNLYPFENVSNSGGSLLECIENIDIGGVSLIRASSKNFSNVVLLTHFNQYDFFINSFTNNKNLGIDNSVRKQLAIEGFKHTSRYDKLISNYLETCDNNKSTKKIDLKYGLNPQQTNSYLTFDYYPSAFNIINGVLGYINVLDIINGWLTVMEAEDLLSFPAAISMKHTSLAGLAIGNTISDTTLNYFNMNQSNVFSDLAKAFMKSRTGDPLSSFGDFICLSRTVDKETALLIKKEVCDGIAAPDFTEEAMEILKQKKGGKFIIVQMNLVYYNLMTSGGWEETKSMYGINITQPNNKSKITLNDFDSEVNHDLVLANIALKYSQSNNISICCDGQIIGMGCGQQNRVSCVKLAGDKSKNWINRQNIHARDYWNSLENDGLKRQTKVNMLYDFIDENPELFENIKPFNLVLASDGFFPFSDNIELAAKYGVNHIVQPGGSISDEEIKETCKKYNIKMYLTGSNNRMFYH